MPSKTKTKTIFEIIKKTREELDKNKDIKINKGKSCCF